MTPPVLDKYSLVDTTSREEHVIDLNKAEVVNDRATSDLVESVGSGRDVEVYVIVCMLSVLAVVGAGGNTVVLNVFSRPTKRDRACPGASATLYVLALAIGDLVTCVVVIPFTIYMEYVDFYISNDFMCKIYQVLKKIYTLRRMPSS